MNDAATPNGQALDTSCARNCGQCSNLILDAEETPGRMEGFFGCQKLPSWQLVSKIRPACSKFAQEVEKLTATNSSASLADLF